MVKRIVAEWLKMRISQSNGLRADEIPEDVPIVELDIDSIEAVVVAGDLEDWLGREVSPELLFYFPTIAELSEHLAETGAVPGGV